MAGLDQKDRIDKAGPDKRALETLLEFLKATDKKQKKGKKKRAGMGEAKWLYGKRSTKWLSQRKQDLKRIISKITKLNTAK